MPTTPAPFQYDYTKYQNPAVSVDFLDKWATSFVTAAGVTGWINQVWAGIVLVVGFAYIWGRSKLVDQDLLIQKQQYELAQARNLGGEVNNQLPPPIGVDPLHPAQPGAAQAFKMPAKGAI